jgi:hypothetical protein
MADALVSRVARRIAFEFDTKESLDEYLRAHPKADKTRHWVKRQQAQPRPVPQPIPPQSKAERKPMPETSSGLDEKQKRRQKAIGKSQKVTPESEYVYHASSSRNLLSIYRKGLIPSEKTNWGGDLGAHSDDKVFFAVKEKKADYYRNILSEHDDVPGKYFFTFRVKTNDLNDQIYGDSGDADDVFVVDPVPPDKIEVKWGEHGWRKLSDMTEDKVAGPTEGEWDDVEDEESQEDLVDEEEES